MCVLCGREQLPDGPGVGSIRNYDRPIAEWAPYWIPFIEDLRGEPGRLVHPECFASEHSWPALVALVTEHDRRTRSEMAGYRRP